MTVTLEQLNHTYLKRLNWLNNEINKRKSDLIIQQLRLALLNTQVGVIIFQDLMNTAAAAAKHLVDEKNRYEMEREDLRKQIEKMEQILPSLIDEETKKLQIETIKHCKDSFNRLLPLQENLIGFYSFFIDLNLEIIMKSLSEIYDTDDAVKIYGAMKKLIEYLLGLSPPGWLISGLAAIRDIINARESEAQSADSYVGYLETFNFSATQWCLMGQLLIDSISGIKSQKSSSIEDAYKKVQERFSSFLYTKTDKEKNGPTNG